MKIKSKKFILLAALTAAVLAAALIIFFVNNSSKDSSGDARFYSQTSLEFDTDSGFYYTNSSSFLCFYDYESKQETKVCNKPNCKHESWNEDTPDEQRCNAFIPLCFTQAGFVQDGQLYILEDGTKEDIITITRSDLDRSNQTVVAEVESSWTRTFVVKGNMLYLTSASNIYETDDEGLPVGSGRMYTCIYSVDLNTGEVVELTERIEAFSPNIDILGVNDDCIYISYEYYDKVYDGTNFDDANRSVELYTYDLNTNKYEMVDIELDDDMILDRIYSNKIIGYSYQTPYDIYVLDLETKQTKTVGSSGDNVPRYLENEVFYGTEDSFFYYNVETETTTEFNGSDSMTFYIEQDLGDYVYGSLWDNEEERSYVVLISKKDFYSNNSNYIELNFYEDQ